MVDHQYLSCMCICLAFPFVLPNTHTLLLLTKQLVQDLVELVRLWLLDVVPMVLFNLCKIRD